MRHLALSAALFLAACNSTKASTDSAVEVKADPIAVAPEPVAAAPAAPGSSSSQPAELTLVTAPSQVCMVNNQFMGREQIPVEVEGKTYFGCCEMCKGRLSRDPSARVAKDPVSGKAVDKSSAVIAKRPNGEVVYFENAANFESYRKL
jgi:YHS domain-containing protein